MATKIPHLSLNDARDVLLQDGRIQICVDALKLVEDELSHGQYSRDAGVYQLATLAGIRADLWYEKVGQQLYGLPGVGYTGMDAVKIIPMYRGQRYIPFDGILTVRFKKLLEANLLSSNYPTTQAERWIWQLPLPGLPDYARLTFGYRPDKTQRLIKDAFVLLRYGKRNYWLWQVWGSPVNTYEEQQPALGESIPEISYFYENLAARP